MAHLLSRFTITEDGENYLLTIEDDGGETLELTATYEQLDVIAEALIEHLDADEDELEVDDEEEMEGVDKKSA